MKIKIHGNRINLRSLKTSDAQSIYEHIKHKEVSSYTENIPYPYRLKDAHVFIKKSTKEAKSKKTYALGIEMKQSKQVIGMMSMAQIDYKNKRAAVGYWLGKKYWGQGIASEALKLLLNFSFRKLKLNRIYGYVMKPNTASARLLERAGFKCEGIMRKHSLKQGKYFDVLVYGLLRKDRR